MQNVVPPKHNLPVRHRPDPGVLIFRSQATIVFLTVCTAKRAAGLANSTVHAALLTAWHRADAWFIGFYLIMPNHIHLFCSPQNEDGEIERWISYWKREFRRICCDNAPRFQSGGFHHRLRHEESYSEKWDYVRQNPVRAGLVTDPNDWPYQGKLNDLYF